MDLEHLQCQLQCQAEPELMCFSKVTPCSGVLCRPWVSTDPKELSVSGLALLDRFSDCAFLSGPGGVERYSLRQVAPWYMYPRYPYEGVLCVGFLGGIQHPFPMSAPRRCSMASYRATGAPGACPTNGVMVWIRRVFLAGHSRLDRGCMVYALLCEIVGWREERPTPDNWDGPTPKCRKGWSEIFEWLNGFRMRVACLQPLMFIQLTTFCWL